MQDEKGNIKDAYSISAGLDYPGIGPEHAYLHKTGRVCYDAVTDADADDDAFIDEEPDESTLKSSGTAAVDPELFSILKDLRKKEQKIS